MKHKKFLRIKKSLYFFSVVCLISCLSCTKTEEKNSAETSITREQIDEVLTEMKKIGDEKGQMIVMKFGDIGKKDFQSHFKIVPNSKKVIAFATGGKPERPTDNYIVTCNWGDGTSKETKCGDDVGCAGRATWACVDDGGCATICNAKSTIRYIPDELLEGHITPLKQLESVFEEATKLSNDSNKIIAFSFSTDAEKKNIRLNKYTKIKGKEVKTGTTNRSGNKQYRVVCTDSNGTVLTDDTYGSKLGASEAVLFCTDELGGCAEVCDVVAFVAFLPQLEKLTKEDIEKIEPLIF